MKLTPKLAQELPVVVAADRLAHGGNEFFPSTLAFRLANTPAFTTALVRRWQIDIVLGRTEPVAVPKLGGGTRLAWDLPATDRILFDSLVDRLRDSVPDGIVNETLRGESRLAAENQLAKGEHSHVVAADVSACFEFIQRSRLISELVDLTGDSETTGALEWLLDTVMGPRAGIPQGLLPSAQLLADAYLSMADRQVARAGIDVIRWVDDYKFPASGFSDGLRIAALLDGALRQIGLTLNPSKTWVGTRREYNKVLASQRWTVDQMAKLKDLIEQGVPDSHDNEPSGEELDQRNAVQPDPELEATFEAAVVGEPSETLRQPTVAESRRVQLSLRELGRTGSTKPLEHLETILVRHPHSTHHLAAYLRRRILAGWEGDTLEACANVLAGGVMPYAWQRGWLLHACVPAMDWLPEAIITECQRVLGSDKEPSFVRGRAAVVLATEGKLPLGEALSSIMDSVDTSAEVDLVIAASRMPETPEVQEFLKANRRDPMLREVAARAPSLGSFSL